MKIVVGLASGLGNCVYMLPAIKALRSCGHSLKLYVQTDFVTAPLWARCAYADGGVVTSPAGIHWERLVCGQWRPVDWKFRQDILQAHLPQIHECEWRSNLRLATALGYHGETPDVSDWCLNLRRDPRWDVGIVPGCKGGTWLRKRWPGMGVAAQVLLDSGRSVAVFGLDGDDTDAVPGERVRTDDIKTLPDALAGCRVVLGTDSGVTHLASSLGVPVVMVYTATSQVKAEPVCQPNRRVFPSLGCYPCVSTSRWQQCRDWKCRNVDARKAVEAVADLLKSQEEKTP